MYHVTSRRGVSHAAKELYGHGIDTFADALCGQTVQAPTLGQRGLIGIDPVPGRPCPRCASALRRRAMSAAETLAYFEVA